MTFIATLEQCLGREAKKNFLPLQPGDVPDTYADVTALVADVGYRPGTPLAVGIANFVAWYKDFYAIS
jgi:UDP-glucuronate 4-epimerase